MVKRLIGSDTTGTDGSVSIPYNGTGAGLVNLSVETEIDGSIVSETYSIYDCYMVDDGTNSEDYFDYGNRTNRTVTNDEITITNNQTGNFASYYLFNKHGTPHSSTSEVTEWGDEDLCLEFELISSDSTSNGFVYNDGSEKLKLFSDLSNINTGLIKLEFKNGVMKYFVDNVEVTGQTTTLTNPFRFGFRLYPSKSITFKNLKIYQI